MSRASSPVGFSTGGSSHHFAAPTLPAERSRQSARTLSPLSKRQKRNTVRLREEALALPAHLGDVVRDSSRFFLRLFPFCGRDRFVSRGD